MIPLYAWELYPTLTVLPTHTYSHQTSEMAQSNSLHTPASSLRVDLNDQPGEYTISCYNFQLYYITLLGIHPIGKTVEGTEKEDILIF